MKRRMWFLAAALGVMVSAGPVLAQTPSPIDPLLHSFPGSVMGTTSAASSGMALADRWLGNEPFLNPAVAPARTVALSPLLQSVSRQDLRAGNRQFDDTPSIDASAGWAGVAFPRAMLFAYGWQPVFRHEDIAFIRGEEGTPPAVVGTTSTQREMRYGVGVSVKHLGWRFGVAGEWTQRDDAYDYSETSGDPASGTRRVTLSGGGFGLAVGARYDVMLELLGAKVPIGELGLALRTVPALDLSGTQSLQLLTGDSQTALSVHRGSALEYGLSLKFLPSEAVSVLAQAGRRGVQSYDNAAGAEPLVVGFAPAWGGVKAGPATQWSIGLDYTEPEQPLSIRFGAGQEVQTGVPEPRAGMYAIGAGWRVDRDLSVDLGVVRRAFTRAGKATSYDDRVVATVALRF